MSSTNANPPTPEQWTHYVDDRIARGVLDDPALDQRPPIYANRRFIIDVSNGQRWVEDKRRSFKLLTTRQVPSGSLQTYESDDLFKLVWNIRRDKDYRVIAYFGTREELQLNVEVIKNIRFARSDLLGDRDGQPPDTTAAENSRRDWMSVILN